MKTFLFPLLAVSLGLLSCQGLFQYSPNEVRLEESEKNLNQRNLEQLAARPAKDSFRFIVIGDSQRFYDQLDDFVNTVNRMQGISFVLLNGDISDFGLAREFEWVNRGLSRLTIPYLAVIGNHDMISNGRLVYNQMFGAENFSFTYGQNKFICFNSNSMERGFDGSLPDLPFLRKELANSSEYNNVFVFSHVPPFDGAFDQKLVEPYNELLVNNNVRLSVHAHTHKFSQSKPYGNDLEYLVTGSVGGRSFALVTVDHDNYSIEEVSY